MNQTFPLPYRWFLNKGLVNWEPWYFMDSRESINSRPNFAQNSELSKQFKIETGAEFDVYLFARRQDQDDFAFFIIEDGKLLDRVVTIHLSFVNKLELKQPLKSQEINKSFIDWVRTVALQDVDEWIEEENLDP